MAPVTFRRVILSMKDLSLKTALQIILTFISVLVCALITPLILRYLLLPRTVTHQQPLDFLFRTCDDQLSGVCSYPEAELDLNELNIPLSGGYYYAFELTLELFDSDQNQKLGVFQTQISTKDANGKVTGTFKKPTLLRSSWFGRIYKLARNFMFFPLYLFGFFSSADQTKTILLTNQYYENYIHPTATLVVQIQNRYLQVSSGTLEIKAIIGFSTYFISEFPILYFVSAFVFCFAANVSLFLLYWAYHGLQFYSNEEIVQELKPKVGQKVEKDRDFLRLYSQLILSYIPGFIRNRIFIRRHPVKQQKIEVVADPEPSPNVWNKNEFPENVSLDENIPGWRNLPDEEDINAAIGLVNDQLEKKQSMDAVDDFMTGTRRRNITSPGH